jgi:hypothetical protein
MFLYSHEGEGGALVKSVRVSSCPTAIELYAGE